jgi:HK97 family phage portal protein
VLTKPNHYQTRIKFIEQWLTSKLLHGNTYVLKERDNRGLVVAMYILDPMITRPMVTPQGEVFYQLGVDNLAGITEEFLVDLPAGRTVVPASEIIHDTMVALYHPLAGISPLSACGIAAIQGLAIQNASTRFFAGGSHPGGLLTAPGTISDEVAKRIKDHWDNNYSGVNSGKVAVLGDGLKFERMSVNAIDAQLIDQLKWSAEQICTAFHVPPFMVGVGVGPTSAYNNVEALTQSYYGQCLQILIESIEALLDEGLALPVGYTTGFDLDDLLLMDTATKVKTFSDGLKGGIYTPNEARLEFDLPPVPGGDEVYLQQQNFSLSALAKRDAGADPFGTSSPAPSAAPNSPPDQGTQDGQSQARGLAAELIKHAKRQNLSRAVA